MKRIGYIGFSFLIVENIIKEGFELEIVICERSRYTLQMEQVCHSNNVRLELIDNKNELEDILTKEYADIYVMCEFGIIIPSEVASRYIIYNIHEGSLENNRGRNPIVTSILRGDTYSRLSMYRVGDGVDVGDLVCTENVFIDENESACSLKSKLKKKIPSILNKFRNYIETGNMNISEGLYIRVQKKDYSFDLKCDTPEIVRKKVNSQDMYGGLRYENNVISSVDIVDRDWCLVEEDEHEIVYKYISTVKLMKCNNKNEDGSINEKYEK